MYSTGGLCVGFEAAVRLETSWKWEIEWITLALPRGCFCPPLEKKINIIFYKYFSFKVE